MTPRRALFVLAALALFALAARWLLVPERDGATVVGPRPPALEARARAPSAWTDPTLRIDREQVEALATTSEVATVPEQGPEVWMEFDAREWPPDPVEPGPASLELRLVDARDGTLVASQVELWRVAAPGNDGWSAGDQLQRTAHVPAEGARFAGLPEGRYRAVCASALHDQPPPELELRAPHAAVELALELPREFELRIRFLDRFGEPYERAEWWVQGAHPVDLAPHIGSHRVPRDSEGFATSEGLAWFGEPGVHALDGPQPPTGFALGRQRECSRDQRLVRVLRLRAPDGALAEIDVPARATGDLEFVAVGLAPDEAAARVRLPDGRASAAHVEALGLARPLADLSGDWRRAPVRILAELGGHAPHSAAWCAADGDLPWILLERLP